MYNSAAWSNGNFERIKTMTLSERQQAILDFVRDFSTKTKYPPTIREIAKSVGISSSVVNYNLSVLEKRGFIKRDADVSRGIKVVGEREVESSTLVRMPIVGHIGAGEPIPKPSKDSAKLSEEFIEITRDLMPVNTNNLFALRVHGSAMVDAMIGDGDIVVMQRREWIHNGEMAAVWLKDRDECTLKYLYLEDKGRVRLQPANPTMSPLYIDRNAIEVQAIVVLVIRRTSQV